MNRKLNLIWLRIREYFKHPAEQIRQADPIIPGRMYSNFGYICKAVRYRPHEQQMVETDNHNRDLAQHENSELMNELEANRLEWLRYVDKRDPNVIKAIQQESDNQNIPVKCSMCGFQRVGIPCPVYNRLADGCTVCDTHKYVILKNPQ